MVNKFFHQQGCDMNIFVSIIISLFLTIFDMIDILCLCYSNFKENKRIGRKKRCIRTKYTDTVTKLPIIFLIKNRTAVL